jgi:putative transposase
MAQGLSRDKLLSICGISKHQFYYKQKVGRRGRRNSKKTIQFTDNKHVSVSNSVVVGAIKSMFNNDLVDYGYKRMTGALHLLGYQINHKKVYRLMKNNRLLQTVKPKVAKNYVQYRIVNPEAPLRLIEMDIKQVWVDGEHRKAFILTIIDVMTRTVIYWKADYHMKQAAVQKAWEFVIENYLEPLSLFSWELNIEIRSDNGPQFCAKKLRKFMIDNGLSQTFTHPYTPQENGHVESFHAIIGRALQGQEFEKLEDLNQWLNIFYVHYNFERVHGSTTLVPPVTFWHQWNKGNINRFVVDEEKRRVRYKLTQARYLIEPVKATGNMSQREVSSLILKGLDSPKNQAKTQLDGAVLTAQPAV